MIRHIPFSEIDKKKYDDCIGSAYNTRIYAESWYLDTVCSSWDILMYGDYEVVMPLPYLRIKRQLFRKKIAQPIYCQQLGVFSDEQISQDLFDAFYQKFISLKPYNYQFNAENSVHLKGKNNLLERTNFVLDLNKPYDELFANFSRSKRQRVRKAEKNKLTIKETFDVTNFIEFHEENNKNATLKSKKARNSIQKILVEKGLGKMYESFDEDGVKIACTFFILTPRRIYYVFASSTELGRKLLAVDFMLNDIIKTYSNQKIILDFEGSDVPSIAKFMSSYGAENRAYFLFNS